MPINFDILDENLKKSDELDRQGQSGPENDAIHPNSGPVQSFIVPIDILDVDAAKARFGAITVHIDEVLDRVDMIEVKGEKEQYEVTEISVQAKTLLKELDVMRRAVIEKPFRFTQKINGWVKQFSDRLDQVVKSAKKKLDDYAYLEIVRKREQERKMQEETDRRQAEIDAAAKKAHVPRKDVPKLPPQVIDKKPAPVRTESGSSTVRMVWVAELEDEAKVPREYMIVDMKKVNLAVKAGQRNIAGFDIKEIADTRFRRS